MTDRLLLNCSIDKTLSGSNNFFCFFANEFSGLNNLYDISIDEEYADICGYTQKELETGFKEYISRFAEYMKISDAEALTKIKSRYLGYSWDEETFLYNPSSILRLFQEKTFDSDHFYTQTPAFLIKLLQQRNNLSVLSDEEIIASFELYAPQSIERFSIVALLFQTGYLSMKSRGCHKRHYLERYYYLHIPNEEVKNAVEKLLELPIND